MSRCCFNCAAGSSPAAPLSGAGAGGRRRYSAFIGWLVPGAALVLVPKCPACLAGYILFATGLCVSISAAAWLRASLIILAAGFLAYRTALLLREALRSPQTRGEGK